MQNRIIEGVWDCQYCKAVAVRGSLRECPQCGHPRDKDVEFRMDNPRNYVYDEEIAARVRSGPDWVCPACDCLNPATSASCLGCGTMRDATTKDYFQNEAEREGRTYNKPIDKVQVGSTSDSYYRPEPERPKKTETPVSWNEDRYYDDDLVSSSYSSSGGSIFKSFISVCLALALVFLCINGLVSCCSPKEISATILEMSWERTVSIDEYKTVRESDWSIPSGGRLVSQSEEFHHNDRVVDHYETKTRTYTEEVFDHYEYSYRDLGNGYFEEIKHPVYRNETRTETYQEPVYKNVPVYKTKYVYDIDKWVHKFNKTTSGNDDKPYWSDYVCGKNERVNSRRELYTVLVRDENGDERTYSLSFDQWKQLRIGETVAMKVTIFGSAEIIFREDE